MRLRLLTIACLLVPPVFLGAQRERVTIRMVPAPNQTLRQRTTEVIETTNEAVPARPPTPAVERRVMQVTVAMDVTSTVGLADNLGRYDARVVFDNASVTALVNGNPMPTPDVMTAAIVGTAFTFHFDEQGKVIGVDAEGTAIGAAIEPFKKMLSDSLAIAAPLTLSIGETVKVPGALALALPSTAGGGVSGPLTITGETRYTLTSITFDGADRVAHLATTIDSTVIHTLPTAGSSATASVETRVTGEGTSDVNIDRGIVLRHELHVTTDSSSHINASPALPGTADMRTRSTVKLTVEHIP